MEEQQQEEIKKIVPYPQMPMPYNLPVMWNEVFVNNIILRSNSVTFDKLVKTALKINAEIQQKSGKGYVG